MNNGSIAVRGKNLQNIEEREPHSMEEKAAEEDNLIENKAERMGTRMPEVHTVERNINAGTIL
jgi:hypothetical protein